MRLPNRFELEFAFIATVIVGSMVAALL